jgi:hypothetical protein
VKDIQSLRDTLSPYQSPIDKFRLELDELWPKGCNLKSINREKMFVGLTRVFKAGVEADAHQDVLEWDDNSDDAKNIKNQLAFNVYLRLPEEGGELKLWNLSFSQKEYLQKSNNQSGKESFIHPTYTPDPDVVIKPKLGEMILINSYRLHGVNKSKGDKLRVSNACFVAYEHSQKALNVWS